MTMPPGCTAVTLPTWFWGSNPAGFFAEAELQARVLEKSTNTWQVQTDERYMRRQSRLVTHHQVAGPTCPQPSFELLTGLAGSEQQNLLPNDALKRVAELSERATRTGSPVDWLSTWALQTLVVPRCELAENVESAYLQLGQFIREGDDSYKPLFEYRGVHVIKTSDAIRRRIKLIGVLLRLAYDDTLASGNTSTVQSQLASGGGAFDSASGLTAGSMIFEAYTAPLCSALAPYIWCVPVHRESTTILYSLGRPLVGTQPTAAELLQLLPVQGSSASVSAPKLSAESSAAAVAWWTHCLNQTFGVLTDPGIFTGQAQCYEPTTHLHAVMTVEQLFRRVHSMQISHRDNNSRLVLLFTILDTLDRLTGRNLELHCSLKFAEKTLLELEASIPMPASEVLLPGARRAVVALRDVQQGFFIARSAQSTGIDVPVVKGGTQHMSLADAAAQYIKVLRNATHGHGSNKENQLPRINALLGHHDGNIPHDLALLGYLYLLDIIANPERLYAKFSSMRR